MATPFVAEIRIFGFNFAPLGWALCNGQVLPISQNTALFSILGTQYGGNGISTYALPNLQGAVPLHAGSGPGLTPRVQGETGGTQTVTLLLSEMPAHTHTAHAAASGGQGSPANNVWASAGFGRPPAYTAAAHQFPPDVLMSPLAINGGSQPHNNLQPYLTVNFCIALLGVFPPRN